MKFHKTPLSVGTSTVIVGIVGIISFITSRQLDINTPKYFLLNKLFSTKTNHLIRLALSIFSLLFGISILIWQLY